MPVLGRPAEIQIEVCRLGEHLEDVAGRPVDDVLLQQAARLGCVTPAQRLAARPEGVRLRAGHAPMLPPPVLRRHRFTLRMIAAAERDGLVAVDLETGRVTIR